MWAARLPRQASIENIVLGTLGSKHRLRVDNFARDHTAMSPFRRLRLLGWVPYGGACCESTNYEAQGH